MVKRKKDSANSDSDIRLNPEIPSVDMADNEAVTRYLVDMIDQLEAIARVRNHDLLAYLLAMAGVQAGSQAVDPNSAIRRRSMH